MLSSNSTLDYSIFKNLAKPAGRAENLIGQRFVRLTPYGLVGIRPNGDAAWLCRCDCGNFIFATASDLNRNRARSCGKDKLPWLPCYKRSNHKMSRSLVHQRWCDMMTRCYNTNWKQYGDYGGRGIQVCPHWHSFENFYEDMGEPPTAKHQLDRLDNDGNYEPANCKWRTKTEQMRNMRSNHLLTINGETKCIAEWAELYGLSAQKVTDRINELKWTAEEALEIVPRPSYRTTGARTRYFTINGETLPMSEWCRRSGVKKSAFRSRLKRGWTPEQALGLSKNE